MSINDYTDELEAAARCACAKAGAIKPCRAHPEVTVSMGDREAERHAYAIATNELKRNHKMWSREDTMAAVNDELDSAADECPQCAEVFDD